MRRQFLAGLLTGFRVVWPILSVLLGSIITLGLVVGLLEGWSIHESIYFAFISGLTIGYGDLAPKLLLTRTLAVAIGACGLLLTALVAAIAVKAWAARFARYAQIRWRRNARVQTLSQRNGVVFHAQGVLRWGRDAAMGLLGERLLDNTWLYDGPPEPGA